MAKVKQLLRRYAAALATFDRMLGMKPVFQFMAIFSAALLVELIGESANRVFMAGSGLHWNARVTEARLFHCVPLTAIRTKKHNSPPLGIIRSSFMAQPERKFRWKSS